MLKISILAFALASFPLSAQANCDLASSGSCYEDSRGNTYHTEDNLGGGYNTYRNGQLDSQTSSNLGGGYKTEYQDGSPTRYDSVNPYGRNQQTNQDNSYDPSFGRR